MKTKDHHEPDRERIAAAAKRYVKLVEWSEEDDCFVGSAPPLIGQCCHGSTEAEVIAQLSIIVEDWVGRLLKEGKPLPDSMKRRKFSGRFVVRVDPELHRKISYQAQARGESLNFFVAEALEKA